MDDMTSIFLDLWDLICGIIWHLPWGMFHEHLKRMHILLFVDGMFHIYLLSPMYLSKILFLYWFFCLDDLSNDVNGVFKYHTIIVLPSVYPLCPLIFYVFMLLCWVQIYLQLLYSLVGLIYHYVVPFFVFCSSIATMTFFFF